MTDHHDANGESQPMGRNPRHFGIDPSEPWPEDVPMDQDETTFRYSGNPKGARRAELRIAFCWSLALLASIGLAWVYVDGGQPQVEATLLLFAFGGLGVGFIFWARDLMPMHEVTASRGHHDTSTEADRVAVAESMERGAEFMARRPFLLRVLGMVGGVFGLAAFFPIASLGDRPHTALYHTKWGRGTRVVTVDGTPVRPGDLSANGILTVFPEGNIDDAQSPAMLINLGDAAAGLKIPAGQESWHINGLVAFSKICTHAGCPVGLYNASSHQLVCPCHQSTFDVLEDCKPVFGPAPRSLAQLPLAVNGDGYLVSQSDFHEAVGPGFWNR